MLARTRPDRIMLSRVHAVCSQRWLLSGAAVSPATMWTACTVPDCGYVRGRHFETCLAQMLRRIGIS